MQDMLEHQVADGILSGEYEKGTVLKVSAAKGKILVNVGQEA